jgi:processive 1,2-diacylglycerol beta-glucosyltransferase
MMRKIEQVLGEQINEFAPNALVSTYPLYPYMINHLVEDGMPRRPCFTVVTDSIEINAAWCRAPDTIFLVADPLTRSAMLAQGCAPSGVKVSGFPVQPYFFENSNTAPIESPKPFRVLFFATARKPHLAPSLRAILDADPQTQITLVLGRNVRQLYHEAKKIQLSYPQRIRLLGWTRRVPQLMLSHHLIVGKAGGATVHEALAACCPMLVHHLVPGQEEGNIALLQALAVGDLADTPALLQEKLTQLLSQHGQGWLNCKQKLLEFQQQTLSTPNAAAQIALALRGDN